MSKGISLCMIVRNEQAMLPRCLDSVAGYVQQIVVVDTGSQDETLHIAQSYGADIYSTEWQDDFANARNYSLDRASGEWILVLDADEEISPEVGEALSQLTGSQDAEAYTFQVRSPWSKDLAQGASRHLALRLFRNRPEYRYSGRVHEQLLRATQQGNVSLDKVEYSGLMILHHGYRKSLRGDRTQRNIRLLEQMCREKPDDAFCHYNLGVSHQILHQLGEARSHYEKALAHAPTDARFLPMIYRNLCICLQEMGSYGECYRLLDQAISRYPDYGDLHFIRGQVCWDLGALDLAKRAYLRCVSLVNVPPGYTTTEGVNSFLALENLAEIHIRQNDTAQAICYLERVLEYHSNFDSMLRWAGAKRRLGITGERLAQDARAHLRATTEDVARVLFEAGDYEACLYISCQAQDRDTAVLNAKSLICVGRLAEARSVLQRWPLGDEALTWYCISHWMEEPRQRVDFPADRSEQTPSIREVYVALDNHLNGHPSVTEKHEPCTEIVLDTALNALIAGSMDLAVEIAAFECSGGEPLACMQLAKLCVEKGKISQADSLIQRALDLGQTSADTYYWLGRVREDLGSEQGGLALLQRAREMCPSETMYERACRQAALKRLVGMVLQALEREAPASILTPLLFHLGSLRRQVS